VLVVGSSWKKPQLNFVICVVAGSAAEVPYVNLLLKK